MVYYNLLKKGGENYRPGNSTPGQVILGSSGEGEGNHILRKEVPQVKKNYLIIDIEPDLMKEFKSACSFYNTTMRDSFITYMVSTVNFYKKDRGIFDKPKIYTRKGGKKR